MNLLTSKNLEFTNLTDEKIYSTVLDWGCGFGRVTEILLNQTTVPKKYIGIEDIRIFNLTIDSSQSLRILPLTIRLVVGYSV